MFFYGGKQKPIKCFIGEKKRTKYLHALFHSCLGKKKRGNPGRPSGGPLFQDVGATQQDLSDPRDLVLLLHGDGKTVTSLLLLTGRSTHSHFFFSSSGKQSTNGGNLKKKKKSLAANVNYVLVTTVRGSLFGLGVDWPRGAVNQRVCAAKFSADGPKIAAAGGR